MKRLYLYLASRAKKGIKLVTVLQSEKATESKLTDLKKLDLPPIWDKKIGQIIEDNKMLYEARVETAEDFMQLRERLMGRGYSDIPMGMSPLLDMKAYAQAPIADTSNCQVRKTMIRKTSNGQIG